MTKRTLLLEERPPTIPSIVGREAINRNLDRAVVHRRAIILGATRRECERHDQRSHGLHRETPNEPAGTPFQ